MKKYTSTKIGLLVGLFSFYSLFSCVTTRQTVGEDGGNRRTLNLELGGTDLIRDSGRLLTKCTKITATIFAGIACVAGITLGPLMLFNLMLDYLGNSSDTSTLNRNNMTTFAPFMPGKRNTSIHFDNRTNPHIGYRIPNTMGVMDEAFIMNATKEDPGALVSNGQPCYMG
ncbi:hypothetical protein [Cardinium endosymbiont of Sogatella furcifera]|uniref:hypothetical protein n=1 Tax=Cardinium endosymbiont of Sogatella furcifera TaxID=650378 RepID=UPI0013B3A53B|nr:hypothetical protein [Cardinium endosymbiont of Sogatella furcifera]